MSDSPRSFMKLALDGNVLPEEIDEFVSLWHKSDSKLEIFEFLGMTFDEYSLWVSNPDMISLIIGARKRGQSVTDAVNDNIGQIDRLAARSDQPESIALLRRWLESRRK